MKFKLPLFLAFLFFILEASLVAEDYQKSSEWMVFRAQAKQEAARQVEQTITESDQATPTKSVGRSVLFSAILPGAGQFYAKSYIKAGIFLGVEIAAWAINLHYNKKGDDKDAEFRAFADRYWSEYRYWSYVNYRARELTDLPPGVQIYPYEEVTSPYNKPWYLIDADFYNANRQEILENLRQLENAFSGFTHHLPETKTQQYYEMIGKYPEQFGNAWEDASFDEVYSGYRKKITALNKQYSDMRTESNHFYDIAGYGAMTALVNHVISAIDAGFTTRNYNRRQLRMGYKNVPINGQYVNMFGLNLVW